MSNLFGKLFFTFFAAVFACLFTVQGVDAASYSINKGDQLSIFVYRQEGMNLTVRVDDSGCIRFPVAGRIQAAGKTPSQIESVIAGALSRNGYVSPEVVVTVASYAPRLVFIMGETGSGTMSCSIPEGYEMTAMQAIASAGGLSKSADINGIEVRRTATAGKTVYLPVPAKDVLAGKHVQDVQLMPGDTVIVPKMKPVSLFGSVKSPGEYYIPHDSPLTMSRLIALAGGVNRPKCLSRIRLNRGSESFEVDIQDLVEEGSGKGDVELKPGDMVYVPEIRW